MAEYWLWIGLFVVLACLSASLLFVALNLSKALRRLEELHRQLALVSKPLRPGDEAPQGVAEKRPESG